MAIFAILLIGGEHILSLLFGYTRDVYKDVNLYNIPKMRITGGKSNGRVIKVPAGIRPTQDRIRALIFNVLADKVIGARFIDLFAGSGSVGIEALSRGANKVIFVEKSKKVITALKDNLKSLGYSDRSNIINKDAFKFLDYPTIRLLDYQTIIFADPPYNKGYVEKIIQLFPNTTFRGSRVIKDVPPKAGLPLIIIEHSKHEPINIGKHYKSGDSIITLIEGGK